MPSMKEIEDGIEKLVWRLNNESPQEKKLAIYKDIYSKFRGTEPSSQKLIDCLKADLKEASRQKISEKNFLESGYRAYYKVLCLTGRTDNSFLPKIHELGLEQRCVLLKSALSTEYYQRLEEDLLKTHILEALENCIKKHCCFLHYALRNVNLLYKHFPDIQIEFSLEKFYFCMESHIHGMKEQTMEFFTHWTRAFENARSTFVIIFEFWPWNSKNKFLFLSVILSQHNISELTDKGISFNSAKLIAGLRFSLSYKKLFSSGQLLVKSLQNQNLKEFDKFVVEVVKTGTKSELTTLESQWSRYLLNKDDLFEELGLNREFDVVCKYPWLNDEFRFPVVFQLFYKQFFSHKDFSAFINCFISNCFDKSLDTQLFVYKIVTENSCSAPSDVHSKLTFIAHFFEKHLYVACPHFRQTILSRIPQIYDFATKKFANDDCKDFVKEFFEKLRNIFIHGISQSEYQPLVFALKLFQVLLKLAKSEKRLMKNANLVLNKKLAAFLTEESIWALHEEHKKIFECLRNPGEYDDVREIIVEILVDFKEAAYEEIIENCKTCLSDSNIDRCYLITYYTKLLVNPPEVLQWSPEILCFLNHVRSICTNTLSELENDPLNICRGGRNPFAYIIALNDIVKSNYFQKLNEEQIGDLVRLSSELSEKILQLLSISETDCSAPSDFQTMEQSLDILVKRSICPSNLVQDRKFLLMSFWMSLHACCDLSSSIGCRLLESHSVNEGSFKKIKNCLDTIINVLRRCRHKGAIEAAGVSLGKLVKALTFKASNDVDSKFYEVLYFHFDSLFEDVDKRSTSRRGAGFTIMCHQLIKNEDNRSRPLLHHAITSLLALLSSNKQSKIEEQRDSSDALTLHYLCILVKDADIKETLSEYYDDIMLAAILRVEEKEWKIRNGALQLFGALVPKIFGQKQASYADDEDELSWNSTGVTVDEVFIQMPKTVSYIIENWKAIQNRKSAFSIVLFLEFLSHAEYITKGYSSHWDLILRYRELFWESLSHPIEKIRILSSKCLAQFHEFRYELPNFMCSLVKTISKVNDDNFTHGLVMTLIECLGKYQNSSKYMRNYETMLEKIRDVFRQLCVGKEFSFYIKSYLVDLFMLCKLDFDDDKVRQIIGYDHFNSANCPEIEFGTKIGFDIWKDKLEKIYKI